MDDNKPRRFSDTHPKMEQFQIEGYKRMTPAQKIKIVHDLTEFGVALAVSGELYRNPQLTDRQARLNVASTWLDHEMMLNAFGWKPGMPEEQR